MVKQNFLTKMLLLCALIVGSSSVWGQSTSTVNASKVTSSSESWTGSAGETWAVAVTGGATNQNVTSSYAQIGTRNSPSTSVTFSTSGISGTITKIAVDCASYNGLATLSATVGGNAFGTQSQSTPSWSNNTGGVVTFEGSATGAIVITMTNGSGGRAMYIKSITVTYTTGGTPTTTTIDDSNLTNKDLKDGTAAGSLSATVTVTASNDPVSGATVTWSSSDEDVATIDEDGVVTLVAVGTTIITATYAGNATYQGSSDTYELEVTNTTPVTNTIYSLATAVVPGRHYIITSGTNGSVKAMGKQNTNNRAAVDITASNGSATIASTAGVYEFLIEVDESGYYTIFDESAYEGNGGYLYAPCQGNNNYLKTQPSNEDGKSEWTISIAQDGIATVTANAEGRNWMRFNSQNGLFSCYEEGQQNIYLFERDDDTGNQDITVSITDAKYATFSDVVPRDFSASGITVYAAEANGAGTSVTLTEVEDGIVPSYTGVVLYSETVKSNVVIPAVANTKVDLDCYNEMAANVERTLIKWEADNDKYNYILAKKEGKVGFYKATAEGAYLAANRAYLSTSTLSSQGGAPFLGFDDETTGIVNVNRETITNNQYYTLDGRRVAEPTKGIYIINGKKVILK